MPVAQAHGMPCQPLSGTEWGHEGYTEATQLPPAQGSKEKDRHTIHVSLKLRLIAGEHHTANPPVASSSEHAKEEGKGRGWQVRAARGQDGHLSLPSLVQ